MISVLKSVVCTYVSTCRWFQGQVRIISPVCCNIKLVIYKHSGFGITKYKQDRFQNWKVRMVTCSTHVGCCKKHLQLSGRAFDCRFYFVFMPLCVQQSTTSHLSIYSLFKHNTMQWNTHSNNIQIRLFRFAYVRSHIMILCVILCCCLLSTVPRSCHSRNVAQSTNFELEAHKSRLLSQQVMLYLNIQYHH